MTSKSFITIISILVSTFTVHAQSKDTVSKAKFNIDFGSATGVFVPIHKGNDDKTHVGSIAVTSLQLNYEQKYFAKLQFGQTTVDFKTQTNFGSINSKIRAKANITNLGISFGYQRSFGRWQPFILGGAGASFIDVPVASFNEVTNTVNFTTMPDTKLYINAGAGVNFKISDTLIILWEGQVSTIPKKPNNSNTNLSGMSETIGIKRNF